MNIQNTKMDGWFKSSLDLDKKLSGLSLTKRTIKKSFGDIDS